MLKVFTTHFGLLLALTTPQSGVLLKVFEKPKEITKWLSFNMVLVIILPSGKKPIEIRIHL